MTERGGQRDREEDGNMDCKLLNLVDDLLVEVLRRIPRISDGLPLKLVCKRINSVMCSEPFLSSFAANHLEEECSARLIAPNLQLPILHSVKITNTKFRVLACLKDLVLCGDGRETFVVFNPFTKKRVLLPTGPRIDLGHKFLAGLTVSSDSSFHVLCFTKDQYGGMKFGFDVWDWVNCSLTSEYIPSMDDVSSVSIASCNGHFYWKNINGGITVYDIYNAPRSLECSHILGEHDLDFHIGVSKSIVHMIVLHHIEDELLVQVWRLTNEAKGEWTRLYEAELFNNWDLEVLPEGVNQMDLEVTTILGMHPLKPEIVYLRCDSHDYLGLGQSKSYALCFDLLANRCWFFDGGAIDRHAVFGWAVYQPVLAPRPTTVCL